MKIDPKALSEEAWADNVRAWPEVEDGKLYSYTFRGSAVEVECIGKYKDQKKMILDRTLTFLKCKVCLSQKV